MSTGVIDTTAREDLVRIRTRQLLLRIAADVRSPEEYSTPSIARGSALNAILLTEADALCGREEGELQAAACHLRRAMTLLDEMPLSSSLYRGITGFGWALQSFPNPDLFPERDEILYDLDELLVDGIEVTRNHNIDIINGIAGIVVYALARGAGEDSSRALWKALSSLLARYLSGWKPGTYESPEGTGNDLGLAHGPPGLLGVGAVAHARGFLSADASASIKLAYDTLWSLAQGRDGLLWYPARQGMNVRSRLAWCYGGLGIAAVYKNGVSLDSANAQRCIDMLTSCVEQYESGDHGIRDASLCHGEAGIALGLSHLARGLTLGSELSGRLRMATLASAERALDSERLEMGVGAFLHCTSKGMQSSRSFLEGGAGVALALVSAYGAKQRPWMELLGYYE